MKNKKNKIAIFIDSKRKSGGAYQEIMNQVEKIKKFNSENLQISLIVTSKKLDINLEDENLELHYFSMNAIERYICYLRNFGPLTRRIKKYFFFKNKFENFLKKINVDVVYFSVASQYSLFLEDIKFIINVQDLNHRENLEFPEAANSSEFERKDEIFKKALPRALAIMTNAEIIKKRISFFYGILQERIFIINLTPSNPINNFKNIDSIKQKKIRDNLKLPKNYIFYPAMYLPHKNHKNLIDAFTILKSTYNNELKMVFCGNDVGYLDNLKTYANSKGLEKNILFLDFIEDDFLPYLYLDASVMTMPALMGPANLPPLEAFRMKVPVVYSNMEGLEKIFGDAVYYVDPLDPKSIANAIKEILENKEAKNNLIEKGQKKLQEINTKNEFKEFFEIVKKYRRIKQTWELDS